MKNAPESGVDLLRERPWETDERESGISGEIDENSGEGIPDGCRKTGIPGCGTWRMNL